MRKVIFAIHITLDGFVAGPNGEMDWISYPPDLQQATHALHSRTDTAIYGHATYEMMAGYWPTVLSDPNSDEGDRPHAHWLKTAGMIVAARSPLRSDWGNPVIIGQDIAAEIAAIKAQPGKELWLIGSPTLAQTFMQLDLIDEYHINTNPVILGRGKLLFPALEKPLTLNLTLTESRVYGGGVVGSRYTRVR